MALQPHHQVRIASGLDTLAGVWLFLSSLLFAGAGVLSWNLGVAGAVVAVLAGSRAFGGYDRSWPSWVNAVLGLWTMTSPWVLVHTLSSMTAWNSAITGLFVTALAVWSALATDLAHGSRD